MAYPNKVRFDSSTPKKFLNFNQVFRMGKLLGQRSFGQVYQVFDIINGKLYALKMFKNYDQSIFKEIDMLKTLSQKKSISQDVVHYYDHFIYKQQLSILMEYIDGVDADKHFKLNRFGLNEYISFSLWLTRVISQLHQLGYVHRDIKPQNIIVVNKNKYKLIDFGFSCRVSHPKDPLKCQVDAKGTPVYIAPELWNGSFKKNINFYYKSIDVYAVGVSLYHILSRAYPYKLNTEGRVVGHRYHYINIKSIPKELTNLLNDILYGMVKLDPLSRLTATQSYYQFSKYKKLWKSVV